jgi:hypothetical protein
MDAAQLFPLDPIPAKAKKLGLLSICKFMLKVIRSCVMCIKHFAIQQKVAQEEKLRSLRGRVSTEVTFWHSAVYGSDFRRNSGEIPRNSAEFRGISPELRRNHYRSPKFRGIPCRRNSVDTLLRERERKRQFAKEAKKGKKLR